MAAEAAKTHYIWKECKDKRFSTSAWDLKNAAEVFAGQFRCKLL